MKKIPPVLNRCLLFKGLAPEKINLLLDCIVPRHKKYAKETFILMEDDEIRSIGVVVSGAVHIVRDDYWGNRVIVAQIGPGEIFGEVFVCSGVKKLPVSVVAAEKSEVLLLDFNRIITTCPAACDFHTKVIQNTVSILAQKSLNLMEKIECITQHSTRAKILFYLSSIAKRQKNDSIEIPFNRQELADYLSVERSALSAELCRMRDKGLIAFHKNKFRLFTPPEI
jgi:CRP-like cAMP-binding protein